MLRFAIFSVTMLLPAIAELVLGALSIKVSNLGFYLLAFFIHFSIISAAAIFYFKTARKKRLLFLYSVGIICFIIISVYMMW